PQCALVEAVQRVLPREAGAAVHLDRALARPNGGLGRERLRGRRGYRRLLVLLGNAPGGPVGERARELRVGVRVRKLVRDRLVDADRPAELLARLRVFDTELEDALCDADGLGGHGRSGARDVAGAGERRALAALEPAERPRRVDRDE